MTRIEKMLISNFYNSPSVFIDDEGHCKVPEGVKYIPEMAFIYNNKIKSIELPKSLRAIEKFAFAHSSIENIHLPEGVVYIGENACVGCANLDRFEIAKGASIRKCKQGEEVLGKKWYDENEKMGYSRLETAVQQGAAIYLREKDLTDEFKSDAREF